MTTIVINKEVSKVVVVNKGVNGQGVPPGGSTLQFLIKSSNANYDTEWTTLPPAGDMFAANNLSDVADVDTARNNIGAVSNVDSIVNALIFG